MTPRLLDAGDAAFTIEFGNAINPELLAAVQSLDRLVAHEQAAGRLPGLIETMPTFRSLTVFFDPLVTGRMELIELLQPLLVGAKNAQPLEGRQWRLPVCYEGESGPDLASSAEMTGMSVDELIELHSGAEYRVCMLGFLPGFPFMDGLPAKLHLPRRTEPRVRVPAGSVAIAGGLTAIYPWESPGGWHLLGRCPVPLFDAARESPSLLGAGDRVTFEPVNMSQYQILEARIKSGEADPLQWLVAAEKDVP